MPHDINMSFVVHCKNLCIIQICCPLQKLCIIEYNTPFRTFFLLHCMQFFWRYIKYFIHFWQKSLSLSATIIIPYYFFLFYQFKGIQDFGATEKDQNLNFPLDQLIDHVAAPIDWHISHGRCHIGSTVIESKKEILIVFNPVIVQIRTRQINLKIIGP